MFVKIGNMFIIPSKNIQNSRTREKPLKTRYNGHIRPYNRIYGKNVKNRYIDYIRFQTLENRLFTA